MSMEVRISVFERRIGRRFYWHTLGLGPFSTQHAASSVAKVRQKMMDAMRKKIAKSWPSQLVSLESMRGRRIEKVRLDIPAAGTRSRFYGVAPLIVEPRARGAAVEGTIEVVYHPLRPNEWFVHEPDRELEDEAKVFFRKAWANLDEDMLQFLQMQPKDRLRLIAFSVTPRSIAEKLKEKKPQPFALLGGGGAEKGEALLARLGTNHSLRVVDGMASEVIDREPYRAQLAQLLCGRHKKSVLLVGPSGVGKSCLIQRLVADLLESDDYPSHRNLDIIHKVWSIRGQRIIAGMSYLGQWEQRCVDLVEACRKHKGLLWVEDVAAWGRIGETVQSDRSLSTFFRGPMLRGELVLLGECTPEGYQRLQDEAPGFAASFTTLFVEPTGREETIRMLVHEARRYERDGEVAFDPLIFRMIHDLGGALGGALAFPGKALDLLRALATRELDGSIDLRAAEEQVRARKKIAAIKIYREKTNSGLRDAKEAVEFYMAKGYWGPIAGRGGALKARPMSLLGGLTGVVRPNVRMQEVISLLGRRTGMPEVLLDAKRALVASDVQRALGRQIMGQEDSVVAMRDLVLRLKVGLCDRTRPFGVFLFTGPTGTGKTEMAKCVAEYLYGASGHGSGGRLLRFDMSEYGGPDAPSRLIGDRFQPEGTLTSKVRAQPFCVVLLDEIEKADPSVLNLMLQLFDDGRLTDAMGNVVDFTHTVVIMTSNLGAKKTPSVGFSGESNDDAADVAAAVRAFFPPELFNRIDQVVTFGALSQAAARRIATREIDELVQRRGLVERNVFVRYTPTVAERAVRDGFRARDGARSLKRYLETHLGGFLADTLCEVATAPVRMLWLHEREGRLQLHVENMTEAEAYGSSSPLEAALRWSGHRLRAEIPMALERAEALLESEALLQLGESLSAEVRRFADEGESEAYDLERLRAEIEQLVTDLRLQRDYDPALVDARDVETQAEYDGEMAEEMKFSEVVQGAPNDRELNRVRVLGRMQAPELPFASRQGFLGSLGQLHFLERAVRCGADPQAHAVLIEMTRISTARSGSRFDVQRPGLLEWLGKAYARARGVVDRGLVVDAEGKMIVHDHDPQLSVSQAWSRIVLRVVGPAVRDFFAGEHGSHVRESVSGGTEVVRVRVLPGLDVDPVEHVESLDRDREAFIQALEAGEPLPSHPDAILPIVRRYVFDPVSPREHAWLEVEDYPLMFGMRTRVQRLETAMETIWLLRMGAAIESQATNTEVN